MKKLLSIILVLTMTLSMAGCSGNAGGDQAAKNSGSGVSESSGAVRDSNDSDSANDSSSGEDGPGQMQEVNEAYKTNVIDDKYRTCYEIFVYSFCDSDGDGIGDLNGVLSKLDYLNDGDDSTDSDLGVNEIWLMPVCPSTTYHKYDVTDYEDIDKEYGTMDDFDKLVRACHDRGIRVITDLVLNHTSSEHPWFKKAEEYLQKLPDGAKADPEKCKFVKYYNFSHEEKEGYVKLPASDWYYEARFWEGMPDLNLDNKAVRKEIRNITQFWTDHGVDGFRLDATTSYYTADDDKNIAFMKWLNKTVKAQNPDAYMVGECWANEPVYTSYYKSGVDSFFDFKFADSTGIIPQAVRNTITAKQFGQEMVTVQDDIAKNNPDGIEAPFYTNHDLARSAGYYSQDDQGKKTKFAEGLNLMMSGNAFLYYGEELGMKGSGKDENKRAPMYWTSDTSAEGMTKGPLAMEKQAMKFPALDEQEKDPYSIFHYVSQAIRLRNNFPAIARGKVRVNEALTSDKVLVTEKVPDDNSIQSVVLVYNLSEDPQEVDLSNADLSKSGISQVQLSGLLTVDGNRISLDDNILKMPGQSIAVLTGADQ
jgi:alpha-amylase